MAQTMLKFSTISSGLQQLRESSFTGEAVSVSRQGCTPISQRKARGVVMVNALLLEGVSDHHSVLGVSRSATKQDIKRAYRRLALEYHPDVCNGDHCSMKFQQITNAYEVLLKGSSLQFDQFEDDLADPEGFMGVGDNDWEEWEEWMGWEGAGTYDYSNHVNVNI